MNKNKVNSNFFYKYAQEIYENVDAGMAFDFLFDAHENFNFDVEDINCKLSDINFEYFDNLVCDFFAYNNVECYLSSDALLDFYVKIIFDEIESYSCTASIDDQCIKLSFDDFYNIVDYLNVDYTSLSDLFEEFDFILSDSAYIQNRIYDFLLLNSCELDADADADTVEVI